MKETLQLVALFNAGRYAELERQASALVTRYHNSGFLWKILGAALQMQGKDGLAALKKAAVLLPNDTEAHSNLGTALMERNQLPQAVASFRRALAIKPDFTEVHFNLAVVLKRLGHLNDAVTSYRQVLQLNPNHAAAHNNLGNALKDLGLAQEAVSCFQQALTINPGYAETHCNLADTLYAIGQLENAVASYKNALAINPGYAEAHNNLGNALRDLGQLDEAIAYFQRALASKPHYAAAYSNLGNALRDTGQFAQAETNHRRALELESGYVEAHNNLGNVLKDLGRCDEALLSYRQALTLNPNYAEAHSNLGNALKDIGQLTSALSCYRRAIELKPDNAEFHSNLGNALTNLGQFEAALACYRRALVINPETTGAWSNLLFVQNYLPFQDADSFLADARSFGKLVSRHAQRYQHWPNTPEPGRCLRVGLVSGDLRHHPVGHFVEGILAALSSHAASRIELHGYPSYFQSDALTERIKACCRGWCSAVGLADLQLAERIRSDGIDLLIDLSGHTAHNRLLMFALKPAPVQITWLGYFATTGVAEIDYLIADPWTLPESAEAQFTETIWRLPETRLCFTPPAVSVPVSPLPALTQGYVTFGCFNNLAKLNASVIAVWAKLLHSVVNSRLFLKAKQLEDIAIQQSIIERFAACGIAESRLILEGPAPRAEYLAAYQRVDIALDPFPFTGGTTSAESLWMGVPVLTLAGERMVSRQGVGLLSNAGLPEWIASDASDYVARACRHAGDLQQLAMLRNRLRSQVLASPLFDSERFARHLTDALQGMWQKWCARQLNPLPARPSVE